MPDSKDLSAPHSISQEQNGLTPTSASNSATDLDRSTASRVADQADLPASPRSSSLAEQDSYPLVDAALAARRDAGADAFFDASEEVRALHRDVTKLRERLSEVAQGSVHLARAEAESAVRDIEQSITARPLASVGVATLIGYVFGLATRGLRT